MELYRIELRLVKQMPRKLCVYCEIELLCYCYHNYYCYHDHHYYSVWSGSGL